MKLFCVYKHVFNAIYDEGERVNLHILKEVELQKHEEKLIDILNQQRLNWRWIIAILMVMIIMLQIFTVLFRWFPWKIFFALWLARFWSFFFHFFHHSKKPTMRSHSSSLMDSGMFCQFFCCLFFQLFISQHFVINKFTSFCWDAKTMKIECSCEKSNSIWMRNEVHAFRELKFW